MSVFNSYYIILLLSFVSWSGAAQSFVESSTELGITGGFGPVGTFNESKGVDFAAGLSFSDFNQDGWDDITIGTRDGIPLQFFENTGAGTFVELAPLVSSTCLVKQVLWVDLDNDGDKDLFHTCFDEPNKIYENVGSLVLIDRTSGSGLDPDSDPSTAASFGDIDNDGFLDLYVGNYIEGNGTGQENHLYKSNGDFTFAEVTSSSGTFISNVPTLATSFLDIDHDLDGDLYISIDKVFENYLFDNDGTGSFQDISTSSNTNVVVCAMNSSSGDYDEDGDLDIYVSNTPSGNVLLRNNGDKTFSDVTTEAGVGFFRTGWGTSFIDCDNDGDLDMYVSSSTETAPNALYVNQGDGTFIEPLFTSGGLGGDDMGRTYCNTHGDFNHDGLIDLAISNVVNTSSADQQFRLWKNEEVHPERHWIKIHLEGVQSNRDGVGSWITVHSEGEEYVRYTHIGDGYLGQSSDFNHIGVNEANLIDSLIIEWPSGVVDKFDDVSVDQVVSIVEGSGTTGDLPCPLILHFDDHVENNTESFSSQGVISLGTIDNTSSYTFYVEDFMYLKEGFEVETGGLLEITITNCN